MYGQKPWLPVDLYFGAQKLDMNAVTSTKFVQQLCERLKWAYKIAQQITEKENKRHRQNYDHRIWYTQLRVSDQVLLQRTAYKGKHKIQDHWKDTVYHIQGQPYNGMLVFRITPVTVGGKVRVIHWNLLLPFGGNIEGDPGNEENWQHIDEPQDSISTDYDNRGSEAEVVLTDPKPVGEGDAICVQHIQIEEKLYYWIPIIWRWVRALYKCK